ncbi:MAG: hypothetical protein JRJ15_15940 [Deltaproteobacteria bacterium]|nr:hypothetical protein [Deltaproteobacteria bacterium]
MGVSFEKSTTEFCQGHNTPAQSSSQPDLHFFKKLKCYQLSKVKVPS